MKIITILLLAFSFIFIPTEVDATTDGDRAEEIFREFDDRRRAITYEISTLEMQIIDSRERVRTRELRMYSINKDNESKSLTVFNAPADVRGTGFLNLSSNGSEVQYLYLPALGRVQTISGSRRSDRFMGSDFTFEDLGNINADDYEVEILEETDEKIKIRAIPLVESQYAFIHFFIDAEKYVLIQADYFKGDSERIKELTATDYKEVESGVWRPDVMIMRDLEAERRTELRWRDRTFNEPIPDRYFTERHLTRGVQ